MAIRYRFDPEKGRFTIQAFATGLLSSLGHSPTFAVRDYAGDARFGGGEIRGLELELIIYSDSLELTDRVGPVDRREIEDRMRRDVLETAVYPEIRFQAAHLADEAIAPGRFRLRIGGPLALRGVSRPQQIELELLLFKDGLGLRGGCSLRPSEFGIKPVTALAGAIRLKDELKLSFDLVAHEEES